jgi:hypothetical protein
MSLESFRPCATPMQAMPFRQARRPKEPIRCICCIRVCVLLVVLFSIKECTKHLRMNFIRFLSDCTSIYLTRKHIIVNAVTDAVCDLLSSQATKESPNIHLHANFFSLVFFMQ